jgi:hypothetical protein
MVSRGGAFWGGVLLLVAAVLFASGKGKIDISPVVKYDKVDFVLMEETSQPDVDTAILVNSDKWQSLADRGVSVKRYDVTKDARKPEVEKFLGNMGTAKPPVILVYEAGGKLVGIEASPSLASLDALVKKYTGK